LNLLTISRREAERKKCLSICREEIKRRESKTVVELLNLADSDDEAQRKTRARANRRASSTAETIAASIAVAQRPLKRSGSVAEGLLFKAAANADAANDARNVPGIPPFRGNRVVNSLLGFLNLPIKHNARSLAHACGFPSLSLFG
jgi:hypothetical protein